jgi:Fe-S-cluster-containing hydrogenase component 2
MRSLKSLFWVFACVILAWGQQSCYYDIEEDLYPSKENCNTSAMSYSTDVLPILQSKCLGCHSATVNSGGITLEGYSAVKVYADNGKLGCSVDHGTDCSAMPKNESKMPQCQVASIVEWIDQGALDN